MNNYDQIQTELTEYCESKSLIRIPELWKAAFDRLQEKFGDTLRDQVYLEFGKETIDHIAFLFTPRNYHWYARIALAWHFLFRRKL